MRKNLIPTVVTYGVLALAAGVSLTLPQSLGPQSATAKPAGSGQKMRISTAVRDFTSDHPDFSPSGGSTGHVAGNVALELDETGRPVFNGFVGTAVTDFTIANGATVPKVEYTPMITVLGSAIVSGSYDCPVTVNLHIGDAVIAPWGQFNRAIEGNVNKAGNPRAYVHPSTVAANSPIWIEGRAWVKTSSSVSGKAEKDWKVHATYGSSPTTQQCKVLRNGDTVPNISGFSNQASIKTYLSKYIDASKKKVTLAANQTIYLFELGTTSMNSSAADFQDLVVLVTLGETTSYLSTLDPAGVVKSTAPQAVGSKVASQWKDSSGRNIPPHLNGTATGDVAGALGAHDSGGIKSQDTFSQWFADSLGVNMSAPFDLILTKDSNGVWEHKDDTFFPIDDAQLGNEGLPHNYNFTMNFGVMFEHHQGENRFIEFEGADDVWVFINGKLVMDLGGIMPGTKQYVDVDRLGLSDGEDYRLDFFFAQRNESKSIFNLRTNLDLGSSQQTVSVSGIGD